MPKASKLSFSVETDKPIYEPSDTVSISYKVKNRGDAEATIDFSSGKQFDVVIANNEGEEVWQLSLHMSYIQAETSVTIAAGETKTFEAQWDQTDNDGEPVPLDAYTINAFLTPTGCARKGIATTHIGIRTLPTFSSCEELKEKLEELRGPKVSPYKPPISLWPVFPGLGGFFSPSIGLSSSFYSYSFYSSTYSASSSSVGDTGSSAEYSTTNTQVTGVDEADIIKNDGGYIYMIKYRRVRIIRALPADAMEELQEITYEDKNFNPTHLYVDGNILVVIGKECRTRPFYYPKWHGRHCSIYYYPRDTYTRVYIYDITDREDVLQTRTVKFEARYLQSRKVGDVLYLVMNADPPYKLLDDVSDPSVLLPIYSDSSIHSEDEGEAVVQCNEIAYFPGFTEPNYLIVAAIPIGDPSLEIDRELILGKSENVYCSTENLYVTSTSFIDEDFPPASRRNPHAWIRSVFRDGPGTIVYKFALDQGTISYAAKARVPGKIINQFSMDEYEDHFRIATTTQWPLSNNLIILDDEMKLTAMLEGIAKGEQIKSVRFMGDRAYVVTFRIIDPFFVISVGDPTNPEILGELKIPGYSEYLHPFDPNHIIGFGRQVEHNRELGLKISLFDVTDVNAPMELQTEVIGYIGTDSEVLDDHKALLFSKAKNIMAFPITVTEHTGGSVYKYKYIFQGAYFYYIDEAGFAKEGQDTHYDDYVFPTKYFCSGDDSIRRIIYIGSYYFTISDSKIKAIEMGSYLEGGEVILE